MVRGTAEENRKLVRLRSVRTAAAAAIDDNCCRVRAATTAATAAVSTTNASNIESARMLGCEGRDLKCHRVQSYFVFQFCLRRGWLGRFSQVGYVHFLLQSTHNRTSRVRTSACRRARVCKKNSHCTHESTVLSGEALLDEHPGTALQRTIHVWLVKCPKYVGIVGYVRGKIPLFSITSRTWYLVLVSCTTGFVFW